MGILSWLTGKERAEAVAPTALTDANYEEILGGTDLPVLVDVWSPTCEPCKKLVPVMTSLANRYQGRVLVTHVNAAEAPNLMRFFQVSGTPTVVVMKSGREMGRVVGYRPRSWFEQMIETEFPAKTA